LQEYKKELTGTGLGLAFAGIVALLLPQNALTGWITGYVLGFLAVLLHLAVVFYTQKLDDERFILTYFTGITTRFLLVLILFTAGLVIIKIDQISFTLSFIISYILHSVIEVIIVNKIIHKNAKKDLL
jgi:hypothetical protein